jgi:threonine-phosphate decarboxylase
MVDHRAKNPIQHGGNQANIRARLKLGNRPLLDFSAPLNALGPPPVAVAAVRAATETIDRYPEPNSPRLVERLADFHGVPTDQIIVGAGTTELINLIGQMVRETAGRRRRSFGVPKPPTAHLVEPSYGEYRRTSAQNGMRTKIWDEHVLGWAQETFPEGKRGVFWTGHPNNPSGRAWDRTRLLNLVDRSPSLTTVIDEAYLPFLPDEAKRTLIGATSTRDNLIVLRSMTKIYAFPGLRIGYAVASPDIVAMLRRSQQPWTVTTAAEVAAIAAVDDSDYLRRTVELIRTESARLTERLWDLPGLRPLWPGRQRPSFAPPMANFVVCSLIDTPWTSPQLQDALALRGIFARECSNYRGLEIGSVVTGPGQMHHTRGHLRFCVRNPAENDLLVETLADVMASESVFLRSREELPVLRGFRRWRLRAR